MPVNREVILIPPVPGNVSEPGDLRRYLLQHREGFYNLLLKCYEELDDKCLTIKDDDGVTIDDVTCITFSGDGIAVSGTGSSAVVNYAGSGSAVLDGGAPSTVFDDDTPGIDAGSEL